MCNDTENKKHAAAISGYGCYEDYVSVHEDAISRFDFDRYNRIASCMADFLAGRLVDGENYYVREAVHWQIWFIRQRGSVQACFSAAPKKESFAGYTIERGEDDGKIRLFGMEVCPMMLQILKCGGVISTWI